MFFHSTAAEQKAGKENGYFDPETNTIYIDINAGINETKRILQDQVLPTVSHELVHLFAVEDAAGYAALADLVFDGLKEKTGNTRASLIAYEVRRIEENDAKRFKGKNEETRRAIAEEEIVARACEDRLANSRLMKEFIAEMENKESGLAQKFSNFLGEAISRLKKLFQQITSKLSRSAEAESLRQLTDRLEAIQSQFDALLERRNTAIAAESTNIAAENTNIAAENIATASEQQKNTSDRGVMYSLSVREVNGTEHIVSPLSAKRSEILNYMDMSRKGQLEEHTYFPVSAHTPRVVIDTLQNAGVEITDKSLAMQAKKAKQSQQEGDPHTNKDGVTIRHHALTAEEILEAVDKLEDADTIIQQTDRTKKIKVDGETVIVPAPDNYAVFVTLGNGKECVAIIEFDSFIESDNIVEDGEGEEFHTTVTVFEPDVVRDGMPFDYVEYLLSKDKNRELDIIKKSSESETAHGETYATASETELSNTSISDPSESVNTKKSLTDKGEMKANRAKYMTARELLVQAAENAKKQDEQSPLLREYVSRVAELDKKYIQLEAAEHEYAASIDAYDDAEKQTTYKNKVDQLTREIYRLERDLQAQEKSKELVRAYNKQVGEWLKATLEGENIPRPERPDSLEFNLIGMIRREKAATAKNILSEARRDTAQRMSDYRKSIERKSVLERIDVKTTRLAKKLKENKGNALLSVSLVFYLCLLSFNSTMLLKVLAYLVSIQK